MVRQAASRASSGTRPGEVVRERAGRHPAAAEARAAEPQTAGADARRSAAPRRPRDRGNAGDADGIRAGRTAPATSRRATATSSTPSAAIGKEGLWRVGGHELKLTNLDKPCCSPPTADDAPITKRELIALLRADRADDAAAPRRAPAQPAALPERRRRARASGRRTSRRPRRAGYAAGTRPASTVARTGTPTTTSSPTASRRCAGSATRRASRSTPGPARCPTRGSRRSR